MFREKPWRFSEKAWRFSEKAWRFSEKPWRFSEKPWRFFPGSLLKKFPKRPKNKKTGHSVPKFLVFLFSLAHLNVYMAVFYLF